MKSNPNIPLLDLKKLLLKTYGKDNYHTIEKKFRKNVLALYNTFIDKCKSYDSEIQQKQMEEYISSIQSQYSKGFIEIFTGIEHEEHVLDDIISELIPQKRTVNSFINSKKLIGTDYEKRDFYSIALESSSWKDFLFKDSDKELVIIDKKNIVLPQKINDSKELKILGATIINKDFFENIKTQKFSMAEFYTAKQNEDCQWSGILQNFDVIRNDYDKIKDSVQKGFKNQSCRVSAIVYGNGGCGKSTVLRRLAINLCQDEMPKPLQEQIKIVWLNDGGFEDFYTDGLPVIEQNHGVNFLVIIEDWYRITELDKEIAYKFLKKAKSISNIRIVIGDRIVEKKCKDLLEGDPILLSPDENESIITSILEKNEVWKKVSTHLFADKNNYQCSLFLLLFIMAYASQNKDLELNFSEPKKAFIDIIENDLKFISNTEDKKYVGLSKALYYWSCIYEKHRIFISYDTFLAIADRYNGNNEISKYFSRWEMEDPILDRLKIYINKNYSLGKHSKEDFVQFNHDILADEGLCKIDWGFSNRVKVDLLEIITDFGDDASASSFLGTMLSKEKQIFTNREEKLLLIDKLIAKKNKHYFYVNAIHALEPSDEEIKSYAHKIWEIKNYSRFFWWQYLQSNKNDTIIKEKIKNSLINSDLTTYNPEFIKMLLRIFKDDKSIQKISEDILQEKNLKDIHSAIIYTCLKISKNKEKKQIFYNKILIYENRERFSPDLISNCLHHADDDVKRDFSNKVLDEKNLESGLHSIVNNCLNYADDEIKLNFSNKVLNDRNWEEFSPEIIGNCVQYADDKIKQNFSNKILKDKNWEQFFPEIINVCLHHADDNVKQNFSNRVLDEKKLENVFQSIVNNCLCYAEDNVKRNFSNKVLVDINWEQFAPEILCNCLRHADDDIKLNFSNKVLKEKHWTAIDHQIMCSCLKVSRNKKIAIHFLSNRKQYNWRIIYNSLLCFENENDFPLEVNAVIKEIINNYHNPHSVLKGKRYHYTNLLRINLKNHSLWQKEANYVIKNWKRIKRNIVTNVLYSHRDTPLSTESMCKDILSEWKEEINQPIFLLNNKIHYGDHIKVALGHPFLKVQATIAATEILKTIKQEKCTIPKYFIEVAIHIVEKDIYPEWKI